MGENHTILFASEMLSSKKVCALPPQNNMGVNWFSAPSAGPLCTIAVQMGLRSLTSSHHDEKKRGNSTSSFPTVFFLTSEYDIPHCHNTTGQFSIAKV